MEGGVDIGEELILIIGEGAIVKLKVAPEAQGTEGINVTVYVPGALNNALITPFVGFKFSPLGLAENAPVVAPPNVADTKVVDPQNILLG